MTEARALKPSQASRSNLQQQSQPQQQLLLQQQQLTVGEQAMAALPDQSGLQQGPLGGAAGGGTILKQQASAEQALGQASVAEQTISTSPLYFVVFFATGTRVRPYSPSFTESCELPSA